MDKGYSENVTVDEGTDEYGTNTKLHFEGDSLIVQKSFDAQPLLDQCAALRNATAGERWGEMRKVAEIPMAIYSQALLIRDNQERKKFIRRWLAENRGFITFDRYLK